MLAEALQLSLLARHTEALSLFTSVIDDLNRRHSLDATYRYFLGFAQFGATASFGTLFPEMAIPEKLHFDPSTIELSGVSERWRRNFPLPVHPDWTRMQSRRS
jgi:hypothetical protein